MRNTEARPDRAQQGVVLHSVIETARILGCSDQHVYRLIAAGLLRPVDIGMGRAKTRIRSDDLAAYIDRKTRGRAS